MRVMHERGAADESYWEFGATQAMLINDRTVHDDKHGDQKTPHERKTGQVADLS